MKETIKQLQPYVPEKPVADVKAKYHLAKVVRLSANENPYGTSPKVVAALSQFNFAAENYYPDSFASELRAKVAAFDQVNPNNIVFGVGLDEIIAYLSRAFLTSGDEVIIPAPTFSEYALNAQIEGARIVNVPINQDSGGYNYQAILNAITDQTRLIWLCNPNNPTGTYESVADLQEFMKQVPSNVLVLIDETYIQYVTDVSQPSALPLLKKFKNIGVMRTFSKVYGLANFRVGCIILPSQLASYLQRIRLPYNLNSVSQKAASIAIADQEFVKRCVTKNAAERDKWENFLKEVGLPFYHSQANFVFFQVEAADQLANYLLKNGFQVRTGLLPNWVRVTVGQASDNQKLQQLMRQFLSK